jgi:pyruvate dehydrogenase E2 component (dihydrolipoamide acetyltransferase)
MATDFKFPDLGEGVTEGEIKKWLIKEGDEVKADQSLAEVETDKAVVEMPSPVAGKVLKLYHKEGDTVKVGEVLVTLGAEGEAVPTLSAAPPLEVKEERRRSVSVVGELPEGEVLVDSRAMPQAAVEEGKVLATPAVRKLAKDLGVELSNMKGTGPEGRVTEGDVKTAAGSATRPAPRKVAKFDLYGYVDREPMKGIRRSTAKKMVESSQHAAMVTMMDDADVTELVAIREKLKVMAKEERNVHLTYMPFIIKAVVWALKANRYLNASYDNETEEIVVKKYYNIGMAVAIEEGLLVPVIKAADQKELMDLAAEIGDIIAKAKERKVDLADLKGGTFTITNYGTMAGTYGTPIINYPESAILGVGRIRDMPWVHDGKIEVRKIMPLSITWDHRIMDGAQVAKFMGELIRSLEDPDIILAMH